LRTATTAVCPASLSVWQARKGRADCDRSAALRQDGLLPNLHATKADVLLG
jgi:hypothetical protein